MTGHDIEFVRLQAPPDGVRKLLRKRAQRGEAGARWRKPALAGVALASILLIALQVGERLPTMANREALAPLLRESRWQRSVPEQDPALLLHSDSAQVRIYLAIPHEPIAPPALQPSGGT